MGRVRTDGKQFALDQERFLFRGVTYGTFQPRDDGARFPIRDQVKKDFSLIRDAGFTVVRTYTPPPEDVVEAAWDWGLKLLAGAFHPGWWHLVGSSLRDYRRLAAEAEADVRAVARRLAGDEAILGLSVGNEIPADVVRWIGAGRVARTLAAMADAAREEDPGLLVTYANYPTTEYLPLDGLDFLTFNVFLERQADFKKYVTRLHHLAGDRPLVLGEVGLDAGEGAEGEGAQASTIDWMLETAVERGVAGTCLFSWTDEWWVGEAAVEDWHFGITRADRTPRPAVQVAGKWNRRTVADVGHEWPGCSVVICAFNGADTLEECLHHSCRLTYPDYEVIVVDDGSTDGTADIARSHPGVRLVSIDHQGLSAARNAGLQAASREVVVYLDSDAYPSPEWLHYLALGLDGDGVVGVGGPNVPPVDDPPGAHAVAQAPGGPVHVLLSDDRAEHIPGCNMAFRKRALEEVGGFDPVYRSAGDDVDLCWKVLDRGGDIAFHPAALVWHHRRPGIRAYLRQQAGYGRAEALVQARHPQRFTELGTARWHGRIYNLRAPAWGRPRIYRGLYGTAGYQSAHRGPGFGLDVAHQVGIPLACLLVLTAPFALAFHVGDALPLLALAYAVILGGIDFGRAVPPRLVGWSPARFRVAVALLHFAQPVARNWSRARSRLDARRDLPPAAQLPGPMKTVGRGIMVLPADRPRQDLAADLIVNMQRAGLRVVPSAGWDDYDARLVGSSLVVGELVTSAFPAGCTQIRVRRRPRWGTLAIWLSATGMVALISAVLGLLLLLGAAVEAGRGRWRTGGLVRRVVRSAVVA